MWKIISAGSLFCWAATRTGVRPNTGGVQNRVTKAKVDIAPTAGSAKWIIVDVIPNSMPDTTIVVLNSLVIVFISQNEPHSHN